MDGAMIGRGVFGNPWFFSEKNPTTQERLQQMIARAELFEKLFIGIKNFDVMKKHFKAYSAGFLGAKELRILLMQTESADGVRKITEDFTVSTIVSDRRR